VGRAVRSFRLLLILLILAVVVVKARHVWLPWVGEALVREEGPAKADLAVVLAGDFYGKRIAKAADLINAGYVPAAMVDGPAGIFGNYECDLAIDWAVRQGYPRDRFIPLPMEAHSTREEAVIVLNELARRNTASFLMVTSTYHTARAARVFRSELRKRKSAIAMRVVAAPDQYFQPDSWWRTREGRKIVFIEWSKTVAEAVGL
jgi:uncharacterized SAM-binding protein YcdF (DUF218 family)